MPPIPVTPLLILISAPSGAGKTTLCQQLLKQHPNITRAITCTTRQPRPGEVPGVDYYFLSPKQFQEKLNHGDFLEHATVFGNSYGTLKSEVLDKLAQGFDVLLNIDVQGAESVRAQAASVPALAKALVTVFLTPTSVAELEARLRNRASESESALQQRLSIARQEVGHNGSFDYLLLSRTREEDLKRMLSIVEAEKLRRHRVQMPDFQ